MKPLTVSRAIIAQAADWLAVFRPWSSTALIIRFDISSPESSKHKRIPRRHKPVRFSLVPSIRTSSTAALRTLDGRSCLHLAGGDRFGAEPVANNFFRGEG